MAKVTGCIGPGIFKSRAAVETVLVPGRCFGVEHLVLACLKLKPCCRSSLTKHVHATAPRDGPGPGRASPAIG